MDTLTDILSNFFVSSSKKNKSNKKEDPSNKENDNTETEHNNQKIKDTQEHIKEDTQEHIKEHTQEHIKKDKQEHTQEHTQEDIKEDTQEHIKEHTQKDTQEEDTQEKDESILSSLSSSNSLSSLTSSKSLNKDLSIKKYILRPSDFYKSNILIVNDEIKTSINILSDLLYKLGLMKDVDTIYDNNIHVITSVENKKFFTKMLLDNPYLFFTNFDVKKQLSRDKIKNLDNLEKRTIFIIDNKTLNKPLRHKDLHSLISKNVHVIVISGEDYNLDKTFNVLGNNKFLIHKLNKSKNMQKHFYKTTIQKLNLNNTSFETYYNIINNENIDIKYIILKNNEIRYN